MTDRQTPIRGQSATFSVNGAKQGDAVLLLYPNELTAVRTRSIGNWVYVGVPAIYLGVHYLFFHTIGFGPVAIWYVAGWWAWQALARWLGIRNMAVTTTDGTEYRFGGMMDQWRDHLAKALSAHGREVYVEAETITVMPCITPGESS